jgi:anti-sigma factor RsiW
MNCPEARKFISAFVDDELDVRTNVEVLEHLEMCSECAERVESLQALNGVVASYVGSVEAPARLRRRTARLIEGGQLSHRRFAAAFRKTFHGGAFNIAVAAASILLVFGAIYGYLVISPSAYNNKTVMAHLAMLQDRNPVFFGTDDAERAEKLALFKMDSKPDVPLIDRDEVRLLGAAPEEIELRNVGHFAFEHGSVTVSMFVFEGAALDDVRGRLENTRLGRTKIESRGGFDLVAWQHMGFTYIVVAKMPAEDLIDMVAGDQVR